MAYTDIALTDEHRCRQCGHGKDMLCPCGCCVADEEAAFAELLDNMGAAALRDRDYEAMEYFWRAAEFYGPLPESTVTARMLLLNAALARNEG